MTTTERLGMPLVKTVTSAGPGGNPARSLETNVVSDHEVPGPGARKRTCPLSMLRSCTTGKLADEFWAPLPPEASELPRKPRPVRVSEPLVGTGDVADVM